MRVVLRLAPVVIRFPNPCQQKNIREGFGMGVDGVLGFGAYGNYAHRVTSLRFMKHKFIIRFTRLPGSLLAEKLTTFPSNIPQPNLSA